MKVIFVCTGNTCRSPLAEGYLKGFKLKGLEVESRGLAADGSPVSQNSMLVAKESGLDISHHISKQFTSSDALCDKIICMSYSHLEALKSAGVDKNKLSVLGDGISDPYCMPIEHYRLCFTQIKRQIDKLVFGGFFSDITVDLADAKDIQSIVRLEKLCFSAPWSENAVLESMKAGTHFFVAKINGVAVGYIGISAIAGEGYITNVAVDPSFRRMGVASYLLNRVFSLADQNALEFVSLEVRKSNTGAIALYDKHLFVNEGVRKNFYDNPREDAIIMTRRF